MNRKFVLLLLMLNVTNAKRRNFAIVFDKVKFNHSWPDLIGAFEARIDNRNNNSYLNAYMVLLKSVQSYELRSTIDFIRSNNQRINVYDTQFDACQFFSSINTNDIFRNIMLLVSSSLNTVPKCPLKPHFNYTITDLDFNADMLPGYTPEGNFRSKVKSYINKSEVFNFLLEGRIIHKK